MAGNILVWDNLNRLIPYPFTKQLFSVRMDIQTSMKKICATEWDCN